MAWARRDTGPHRFKGTVACITTIVLLAIVGGALWRLAPPRPNDVAEPPATAAFLTAFAQGNELGMERVASPLFGLERARRGLAPKERARSPWTFEVDRSLTSRLRFTFAGGVEDAGGFLHLLYAVGPVSETDCPATSVWRVDTEPSGRVIWTEMVWLFGQHVAHVVATSDGGDLPTDLLPDDLALQSPRLVAAVRSDAGPEGYYAVTLGDDARTIAFFAITPNGDVRPGTWSYGRRLIDAETYGSDRPAPMLRFAREQQSLRRVYVASLP